MFFRPSFLLPSVAMFSGCLSCWQSFRRARCSVFRSSFRPVVFLPGLVSVFSDCLSGLLSFCRGLSQCFPIVFPAGCLSGGGLSQCFPIVFQAALSGILSGRNGRKPGGCCSAGRPSSAAAGKKSLSPVAGRKAVFRYPRIPLRSGRNSPASEERPLPPPAKGCVRRLIPPSGAGGILRGEGTE